MAPARCHGMKANALVQFLCRSAMCRHRPYRSLLRLEPFDAVLLGRLRTHSAHVLVHARAAVAAPAACGAIEQKGCAGERECFSRLDSCNGVTCMLYSLRAAPPPPLGTDEALSNPSAAGRPLSNTHSILRSAREVSARARAQLNSGLMKRCTQITPRICSAQCCFCIVLPCRLISPVRG